jgi:hypothetical protein
MASPVNETQVFIVRIWPEPREIPDAEGEWRGTVEHLDSKEQIAFRFLDKLMAFIAEKTGMEMTKP